ncbi:IPT/TIG domain-containing protein [Pontibacter chitinilyticus]|uniref:IPT/TIG domain-containing protein n=1 Tax=Pontibacter chitinilyticus TaxID=2674989 RepID=UPI00321BC7E1
MKTSFTRSILYLFLLCLCCCAKEEDFPNGSNYPFMKILNATADSTGIRVKAQVSVPGTAKIQEYGFAYGFVSSYADQKVPELRMQTALTNGELDAVLKDGLIKRTNYRIRAYAVTADGKTVYSPAVTAISLISSTPVITDFSPQEGAAATEVTITGSSFTNDKYKIAVYVGAIRVNVLSADFDKIVVQIPDGREFGSYPLRVVLNGVESKSKKPFKLWGPEITSMSRYEGMPGDTVTLFGNHLTDGTGSTYVTLRSAGFSILSSSNTKLQLVVPYPYNNTDAFDEASPVVVRAGQKAAASAFTFTLHSNFGKASALTFALHSSNLSAFEYNGKGYFFDFDRVISYSIASGTWQVESAYPGKPRTGGVWQRVGNKAYLIGGTNGQYYFGSVWVYDLNTREWQQNPEPTFAVMNAASVVLNDKIYFTGGTNSENSYMLWQYDPATQLFVRLGNAPGKGNYGQAFTRKEKAYFLMNGAVMEYDPANNSWLADSYFNQSSSQAFTIGNDDAYLLTYQRPVTLYHYQPTTHTWEKAAYVPDCSAYYTQAHSFSGFTSSTSLYLGLFTANSLTNSCNNNFYVYKP